MKDVVRASDIAHVIEANYLGFPDPIRLREVVDEISEWTLEQRRDYIANLEKACGPAAAQQIRDALTARWLKR